MKDFAASWEFKHTTSSPEFPQSNGQAERAIQTVKNLLKKAQESIRDPYIALLEYRNTPLDGVGYSPAQLLMGRRLKTKIPVSRNLLKPRVYRHVRSRLVNRQEKQRRHFDRGTRNLPSLEVGGRVRVRHQKQWQPAVARKRHDQLRSYIVRTDNEQVYRRNRRHIQKTKEMSSPSQQSQHETVESVHDSLALMESTQQLTGTDPGQMDYQESHITARSPPQTPKSSVMTVTVGADHSGRCSRYGRPIRAPVRYKE